MDSKGKMRKMEEDSQNKETPERKASAKRWRR